MKYSAIIAVLVPILVLAILSCPEDGLGAIKEIEDVVIDQLHSEVALNETMALYATVKATGDLSREVVWESEDPDVASVDRTTGIVTPHSPGAVTMIARSVEDSAKSDSIRVVVIEYASVESVTIDEQNVVLEYEDLYTMSAKVIVHGGLSTSTIWESSNPDVADIDRSTGVVTINGFGETVVTVFSVDDPAKSDTTTLTVAPPGIESVRINQLDQQMVIGGNTTLSATVVARSGAKRDVLWKSADPEVASVDSETGKITAHSAGEVSVYAASTVDSGKVDGIVVNVFPQAVVEEVVLLPEDLGESITLEIGEEYSFSGKVIVSGGASTELSWESSNPAVAAVDVSTGVVETQASGEAKIIARSVEDNTKTDEVTLKVLPSSVRSVAIDQPPQKLALDGEVALTASVVAVSGAAKGVTWGSDNPAIATIDAATGIVTPVSPGMVEVTATSVVDNTKKDSLEIEVFQQGEVTEVAILEKDVEMEIGGEYTFSAMVAVLGGASTSVRWFSSDPAIATVDEVTGNITAVSHGQIEITAVSEEDQQKGDFAFLTILPPSVNSIAIAQRDQRVALNKTLTLTAMVDVTSGASRKVRWESSDLTVAKIDEDTGVILPYSTGRVTITAFAVGDPAWQDTTTVTVIQHAIVESVTIQDDEVELEIGESHPFTAEVVVKGGASRAVLWESDDPGVATVDEKLGVATAQNGGETRVIAFALDDNTKIDTAIVRVLPPTVVSIGIDLPGYEEILIGDELSLTAEVETVSGASREIAWRSQDTAIATVDKYTGTVTTHAEGEVELVAYSIIQPDIVDTILLSVFEPSIIEAVEIVARGVTLMPGEAYTYSAEVAASGRASSGLRWSSSNAQVATIDEETGGVTVVGEGVTQISAVSVEDPEKSDTVPLTVVYPGIGSVVIQAGDGRVALNETLQLTAVVVAEEGAATTESWSSSDPGIVLIDADTGLVTPVALGDATITVTSTNSFGVELAKQTTITVYQNPVVESVEVVGGDLSINIEGSHTYSAEVETKGGASREVYWSSSNPEVAGIDQKTGKITPHKGGSTQITAVSVEDSGVEGSSLLTILAPTVEAISIVQQNQEIMYNGVMAYTANVTVSNGASREVYWESKNLEIAVVGEDSGLVTPRATGSVTITATSVADPGKVAITRLTILPVTYEAISDTSVVAGEWENTNYGSDDRLEIRADSPSSIAYLDFDLGSFPWEEVRKAELRLHVSDLEGSSTEELFLRESATGWPEGRVTWSTAPEATSLLARFSVGSEDAGRWLTIDITEVVNTLLSSSKSLSLAIGMSEDSGGSGTVWIDSKEGGSNPPQIILK